MLGSCGAISGRSPARVVTRSWFAPRTAGARYNLRSGGTTSLTANRACMTSPSMSKSERDTTMHTSAIAEQATSHESVVVLPDDEHNQKLVSNVRPPDWVNPDPTGTYNIVVIGAGTAGLVTAVIAAGGGAKVALIVKNRMGSECRNVASEPATPRLKEAGYLPNETVFTLTELPPRLGVIRAGPIGCELAQAFARFGSQVYLIEAMHGIMPNEDRDAAEIVYQSMLRDGIKLLCCGKDLRVKKTDSGKRLTVDSHGQQYDITVDEILVGVGRTPNTKGLGLETVGVEYDKAGVKVNDRLQTTNPRIYAAGDICSRYKFTHAADAMAQILIQNTLFPHPLGLAYASADALIMPWCTFTEPEIAHVGMYEADAKAKGIEADTFTFKLDEVDRAILDGEDEGFARVHVKKGTDQILGATIVAYHAGDMINEFSVLMKAGLGLKTITGTIHPYPTQAEVVKKVANAWRKTTFTPRAKRILSKWFAWTRR